MPRTKCKNCGSNWREQCNGYRTYSVASGNRVVLNRRDASVVHAPSRLANRARPRIRPLRPDPPRRHPRAAYRSDLEFLGAVAHSPAMTSDCVSSKARWTSSSKSSKT